MQPFITAALEACQEVNRRIHADENDAGYVTHDIGEGGDVSSGFDLIAEAIYVEKLGRFGQISSEESGLIGEGEDMIVLDPIDGSDNLKSRFPYYGASIALQRNNETVAAIVCNFASGECFVRYADQHYKTYLHNSAHHETIRSHEHSSIGLFERARLHPGLAKRLADEGYKFRSPGAVALSLAYAHYASYVLFLGTMRPYDVEAGLFLCQDLYCDIGEGMLLVSKDKATFERVREISRSSH